MTNANPVQSRDRARHPAGDIKSEAGGWCESLRLANLSYRCVKRLLAELLRNRQSLGGALALP